MLRPTNSIILAVDHQKFDGILELIHAGDGFDLPKVVPIFAVEYIAFAVLQTWHPFSADVGQT